jgi:hypothetical protein
MMMLAHGKLVVHSQQVVYAMRETAGTHYTVSDRRLTPAYWASPDRRRGLARMLVFRRFDRK